MQRPYKEVQKELSEFFEELAHNLAIEIANGQNTHFLEYLVTRIYNILYITDEELGENK